MYYELQDTAKPFIQWCDDINNLDKASVNEV